MHSVTLPVYFTQEFKSKSPKTFLVSLNWYRNAHYFQQNLVKRHYHEILHLLLKDVKPITGKYVVEYTYYYKTKTSDMPNVTPMCSKWLNDALQHLKLVENDNVQYLVEEVHRVGGYDKDNPRCEILIKESNEQD